MKKILILNGPNLNLLHIRDKDIYGYASLVNIEKSCVETAQKIGLEVYFRQTNSEGGMVEEIQEAIENLLIKERLDLPIRLRELDADLEKLELRFRKVISSVIDGDFNRIPGHILQKVNFPIENAHFSNFI